jgi:hypothetical protein
VSLAVLKSFAWARKTSSKSELRFRSLVKANIEFSCRPASDCPSGGNSELHQQFQSDSRAANCNDLFCGGILQKGTSVPGRGGSELRRRFAQSRSRWRAIETKAKQACVLPDARKARHHSSFESL